MTYRAYTISLYGTVKYVGITTTTIARRWSQHCCPRSRSLVLRRGIAKYGKNAFEITQVASSWDLDSMNALERLLIKQHRTFGHGGYNLTDGGGVGRTVSEEIKKKMSEKAIQTHSSPAMRAKMSASATSRYSTPEGNLAQSLSQRARWTLEARKAQAERARVQMRGDRALNHRKLMKQKWSDPVYRTGQLENMKVMRAVAQMSRNLGSRQLSML